MLHQVEAPCTMSSWRRQEQLVQASRCSPHLFLPLLLTQETLQAAPLPVSPCCPSGSRENPNPSCPAWPRDPHLSTEQRAGARHRSSAAQWGCPQGIHRRLVFPKTSACKGGQLLLTHYGLEKCKVCVFFYPFPLQNIYSPLPPRAFFFFFGNYLKTNRRRVNRDERGYWFTRSLPSSWRQASCMAPGAAGQGAATGCGRELSPW